MIEKWWLKLDQKFPEVILDEYAVMTNHFHGVLLLQEIDRDAGHPLSAIVQWFKSMTTNEYIHGVRTLKWTAFDGKLWQRTYYEHIIRNEPI
jgi:REP element-mobilizing transposase RayT